MGLDPTALIGGLAGLVGGLFKSRKHYHVYYWDGAAGKWVFVMDGIPSQVKPVAQQYAAQGIPVQLVRNKGGTGAKPPTQPPAGWSADSGSGSGGASPLPWILAGVGGLGLVVFLLLRKRR